MAAVVLITTVLSLLSYGSFALLRPDDRINRIVFHLHPAIPLFAIALMLARSRMPNGRRNRFTLVPCLLTLMIWPAIAMSHYTWGFFAEDGYTAITYTVLSFISVLWWLYPLSAVCRLAAVMLGLIAIFLVPHSTIAAMTWPPLHQEAHRILARAESDRSTSGVFPKTLDSLGGANPLWAGRIRYEVWNEPGGHEVARVWYQILGAGEPASIDSDGRWYMQDD